MKKISKLIALASLGATLVFPGCNNELTYSSVRKPFRQFQGYAGVDQWSKFVELRSNDGGYIFARPDSTGKFNLIEIGAIDSFDTELIPYEHPDSLGLAHRELTGRRK